MSKMKVKWNSLCQNKRFQHLLNIRLKFVKFLTGTIPGKISLGDAENEMTSLGYALDIPDDTTDTSADIVISVPSRLSEDNVRPTGEVTSRGTAASVDAVTKTAPQEDLNIEVQKDAPVPEQPKQVAEKPTPPSADPPDIQIDEPTQRTLPLPSIFAPAVATAGRNHLSSRASI